MAYDEGGVSALFGEGGGGGNPAAPADPANPAPVVADPAAPADPASPPAAPEWMQRFSADPVGETASHRDYLTAKGFKDENALVASYRELEQRLSGKGAITVPGENATDAERAAYRTAIGVPEKVEGYEVTVPENGGELDTGLLDFMRGKALEGGAPAAAFKTMADGLVEYQLGQLAAEKTKQDGLTTAKLNEWGPKRDQNLELARRGAKAFGISADDVQAMQRGMGSDRFLDLALKLGSLGAEADLIGGGAGGQQFGVASAEDAQRQIDAMIAQPGMYDKIRTAGSPEKATYDRLNRALAHYRDRADAAG